MINYYTLDPLIFKGLRSFKLLRSYNQSRRAIITSSPLSIAIPILVRYKILGLREHLTLNWEHLTGNREQKRRKTTVPHNFGNCYKYEIQKILQIYELSHHPITASPHHPITLSIFSSKH